MMSPTASPPATSPAKRLACLAFITFLLTFIASRVLVILILASGYLMYQHLGGSGFLQRGQTRLKLSAASIV